MRIYKHFVVLIGLSAAAYSHSLTHYRRKVAFTQPKSLRNFMVNGTVT